jgi:hypothetical protein
MALDAAAPSFDTGPCFAPLLAGTHRSQRILDSLREEILEGGEKGDLRIRCVFREPKEVFRLELRLPELAYQRITLLERDALEELLETDGVRALVETATVGG